MARSGPLTGINILDEKNKAPARTVTKVVTCWPDGPAAENLNASMKQYPKITREPDTARGLLAGAPASLTQEDRGDYRVRYHGYSGTYDYPKILSVFLALQPGHQQEKRTDDRGQIKRSGSLPSAGCP
jgi:hypothetical protein